MHVILEHIIGLFRNAGIKEMYPSFDAVPLSQKSDRLFSVMDLESLQLDTPFPDGKSGVHPFVASVRMRVLVPMHAPLSSAEAFFYGSALPILQKLGAVPGEIVPPVVDVKLQRIVMSGKFRLRGLYLEDETISVNPVHHASADAVTEVSE